MKVLPVVVVLMLFSTPSISSEVSFEYLRNISGDFKEGFNEYPVGVSVFDLTKTLGINSFGRYVYIYENGLLAALLYIKSDVLILLRKNDVVDVANLNAVIKSDKLDFSSLRDNKIKTSIFFSRVIAQPSSYIIDSEKFAAMNKSGMIYEWLIDGKSGIDVFEKYCVDPVLLVNGSRWNLMFYSINPDGSVNRISVDGLVYPFSVEAISAHLVEEKSTFNFPIDG